MEIKFITHSGCSKDVLDKIGALKKQHWDYSVSEQVRWFNNNLSDQDIHLCIFEEDDLIAYTTILNIKYLLENNIEYQGFGIGSVCVDVDYLNKKYGFFVIQIATAFIKQKNMVGILLCRDELIAFYEKNNWIKFIGQLEVANLNKPCNILTTETIPSNSIILNKSF